MDATLPARAASAVEQQRWQQQRAAKLRDVFADYAASVEIGLRRPGRDQGRQDEERRRFGRRKGHDGGGRRASFG